MKKIKILLLLIFSLFLISSAQASQIIGGDALDQASADDILDIIFLIDTSGSMYDDINAIGSVAQSVIQNLQCPDCDVYVRATFAGLQYGYGSVFDEGFTGPNITNSGAGTEDNGGGALDAINSAEGTWWTNDAATGQDYYRAVVTIGDEGTENGTPVTQADWDIAYAANQAAIAENVFLFGWVTDDPYYLVPEVFSAMSIGGSGGGYTFGATGGGFVDDSAGTGDVAATLERIICTAGSGGTNNNPVPEPGTIMLFGIGLLGLAGVSRKK